MHELLAKLFLEKSLSETNEIDSAEDETDSESALLENSISFNSIGSGYIRELISTPIKGEASSNKKEKKTAFRNEITMNSKTYRKV